MDWSFLNFQIFKEGFSSSLFCKHAPKKTKANKPVDIFNYKKQRNLVLKINNECKREYFDKLKVKTAVKPFWKTCKPSSQTNIYMVAPK